ncbi:MAG TPA: hypothetical protein VGN72_11725 [Tepidisphaeraceae bacterium]|nr:hypothetical protein [Tepidisphaeraceae bacterium]
MTAPHPTQSVEPPPRSAPAGVNHAKQPHRNRPIIFPLLLWLAVQLAALVAGAMGWRWSANYTDPGDLESLRLMLIVQVSAAALLSRYICRDPIATIACAFTVWPFAIGAAYLSATPFFWTALAATYISVWVLSLGLLRHVPAPLSTTVPALLAMIVLGVPGLNYLSQEFGSGKTFEIGPIYDILDLMNGTGNAGNVLLPTVVVLAGLVFRLRNH